MSEYIPCVNKFKKCVEVGNVEMFKMLVESGLFDVNEMPLYNEKGFRIYAGTFLMHLALFSAQYGVSNVKCMKILIDNGANVNLQKDDGWTALMLAVHNYGIEQIKLLLGAGANVNLKNDEGETVLDLLENVFHALDYRNQVEKLLTQYGAKHAKDLPK